jgi:hypothetical protein
MGAKGAVRTLATALHSESEMSICAVRGNTVVCRDACSEFVTCGRVGGVLVWKGAGQCRLVQHRAVGCSAIQLRVPWPAC